MLNHQKKQPDSILFSLGNIGGAGKPLTPIKSAEPNAAETVQGQSKRWIICSLKGLRHEKMKSPHLWSCSLYSKCFLLYISWNAEIIIRESIALLLQCDLRKTFNTHFKYRSVLIIEESFWMLPVRCTSNAFGPQTPQNAFWGQFPPDATAS